MKEATVTIKTSCHAETGKPLVKTVPEWHMMILGKYKLLKVQAAQANSVIAEAIFTSSAAQRASELLNDPKNPWTRYEIESFWTQV